MIGPLRPPPGSGEPVVERWRSEPLVGLLSRLRPPGLRRPWTVAVDGRSAGGKTTLGERIHAALPGSVLLHTDDVAWNHSILGWDGVLTRHVLDPVRAGEPVDWSPPGWGPNGRSGSLQVPGGIDALVVEGVGCGRRELAAGFDTVLWMQSDWDDSYRRGIRRDVGQGRDETDARAFWEVWMAEERPFHEQQQTWARADAILAGARVLDLAGDEVAVADVAAVTDDGATVGNKRRPGQHEH